MHISQEFYCGECKHYFLVNLNIAINFEAEIVCPGCQHEHRRCIVNGVIYESGRFQTKVKEKIYPMRSTLSKEPLTKKMREAHDKASYQGRRDGVPLFDRWLEIAARERGEVP